MSESTLLAAPTGFASLPLDPRLIESLTKNGYTEPTPIQRQAIPPLLEGNDLIGLAATGTGKTAAFSLPLLHRLAAANRKSLSVLVLVPTRELCIQVGKAMSTYGKALKVKVVPVYGGAEFGEQVAGLRRGADVVVATPGRALDHLRRGTLKLDTIEAVVLDEADEMLDMGFAEDLDAILAATPENRQVALFSATMPPRIAAIAAKHLTNPVRVTVTKSAAASGSSPRIRQVAYLVPGDYKIAALARVLDYESPTSAIVFCRTRHETEAVADKLASRGHRPESLHGGLSQEHRDRVMRKFREGTTPLLIATDVAARGLDISHLSHVINFGVPQTTDTYVHRIGRVGRAGREGVAMTLADPRETMGLRAVERATGGKLDYLPVPTGADLRVKQLERTRDSLRELLESDKLDELRALVGPLLKEYDAEKVALAATSLALTSARFGDDGPDIPVLRPPQAARSARPIRAGGPGAPAPQRRSNRRMAQVSFDVGRMSGVSRRDLLVAFESEVGLGSREIGTIEVADRFSHVEVPEELIEHVVETLDGIRLRGRKVVVRRS